MYSNGLNEKGSRIRRGGHARAGVWVIRDSGENKQRLGERKEVVHVERGQPCLCRSLERPVVRDSMEASMSPWERAEREVIEKEFAHAFREKDRAEPACCERS